MYFAPGTVVRMSLMGTLTSLSFLSRIAQTIGVAAVFGGITAFKFFINPLIYVLLLFLPTIADNIVSFDDKISKYIRAWHIFILVFLLAPFQQAIGGWAMGANLPPRAEGLAIWIMAAAWVFLWVFCYRNECVLNKIRSLRVYRWRNVMLALCLVLNSNFISLVKDLRVAPLYLAENKERENIIQKQKEEGKMDIVVPALTVKPKLLFFAGLQPFSSDWKNVNFAKYWNINSVSALPLSIINSNNTRKLNDFKDGKLYVLEEIAGAGDMETAFNLGEIYDTTFAAFNDIPKDNAIAAEWYLLSANRGDTHAMRRLTRLYANGSGVPQSYPRAIWWLLRSQF
ncbi:hypothetical protein FACS1894204_07090 [Synergistales bacterium]|nr:hypothetical protein FACS1894204_07090 [Synergistales bacterium]